MENRFNLIDEPWIPVVDHGRVSLRLIFSNPEYRSLGGNPVQKIALLKLLLAIAQAASTPEDEVEWRALGVQRLAERCLAYLDEWHERFYLYGEKPFLQMPKVADLIEKRTELKVNSATSGAKKKEAELNGEPKSLGAGFYPDLPSSNNTVLSHTLVERNLSDADKAIFVVSIMNFAFGGKRVEGDMDSLHGKLMGNRYSAPAGPSMGGWTGYLHSFLLTGSILSDIWINTLTESDVRKAAVWPQGIGKPIWEELPSSEGCEIANQYKSSYMATLVAMSRFSLLAGNGIYYMDGLNYPSTKNGWFESGLILDRSGSDIKTKYVDPEKRPWRELEGLLSFIDGNKTQGFDCLALRIGIERGREHFLQFAVWAGGLKVSVNSGDQSVKQSDDFVESIVWLHGAALGKPWIDQLKREMSDLESLSNILWSKVFSYFKSLKADNGKKKENTHAGKAASQAKHLFWQLCEREFQNLVDHCDQTDEAGVQRRKLRQRFADYIQQAYDKFCPRETARQLDAWAKCRPNNSKYLNQEV
ncbi:type I-E CRISPR-associated protein Cse1/CasA [Microbulbifer rhizosphaerae]|uniref:CRISPR system Cascade subunit CasA n=1 Tax=Microbulbifer rhizosphaerae TaxID=1562603 RepID=A0A7W4ZAF4_9GAMM|nr:type I-E CRISPR-associated protein Cse1/CasA [Microbulbifer rhizosphaerae]MBB3062818.1 CRISPR system Cascade subunit CasA [Microbulbifer rhizosphaerae]